MDGINVTQLGVSGVVVVLLLIALKVVWDKYQGVLEERGAVLLALQRATDAMADFARTAAVLLDRRDRE